MDMQRDVTRFDCDVTQFCSEVMFVDPWSGVVTVVLLLLWEMCYIVRGLSGECCNLSSLTGFDVINYFENDRK